MAANLGLWGDFGFWVSAGKEGETGLRLMSPTSPEAFAFPCLLPTEPRPSAVRRSFLDGVIGIANPLRGPFARPATGRLAKHPHMFVVPCPFFKRLLALTGIGFSWCLLWRPATTRPAAGTGCTVRSGVCSISSVGTGALSHSPMDSRGLAPPSELMTLDAALRQELWVKSLASVPGEQGSSEACCLQRDGASGAHSETWLTDIFCSSSLPSPTPSFSYSPLLTFKSLSASTRQASRC